MLRVVGCMPSAAGLRVFTEFQRAGVGQASREETAGGFAGVCVDRRAMGIGILPGWFEVPMRWMIQTMAWRSRSTVEWISSLTRR